jgi:hypothetical protein
MARGHRIIHTAGLHRESIASGGVRVPCYAASCHAKPFGSLPEQYSM